MKSDNRRTLSAQLVMWNNRQLKQKIKFEKKDQTQKMMYKMKYEKSRINRELKFLCCAALLEAYIALYIIRVLLHFLLSCKTHIQLLIYLLYIFLTYKNNVRKINLKINSNYLVTSFYIPIIIKRVIIRGILQQKVGNHEKRNQFKI